MRILKKKITFFWKIKFYTSTTMQLVTKGNIYKNTSLVTQGNKTRDTLYTKSKTKQDNKKRYVIHIYLKSYEPCMSESFQLSERKGNG